MNQTEENYQKESQEKLDILFSKLSLKNANVKTKKLLFKEEENLFTIGKNNKLIF